MSKSLENNIEFCTGYKTEITVSKDYADIYFLDKGICGDEKNIEIFLNNKFILRHIEMTTTEEVMNIMLIIKKVKRFLSQNEYFR
ncbi:MAG: hypothetical protein LBV03_05955 [Fusobacteriales bacterium]|jgi:hypothetical protein|nr:hypothetical protein [Fusobacteriales bacterium]